MGVSEEIRQKLLQKFQEVTADRLQKIQLGLLELEREPATPEAAEEVARELHTMKGEARMLGLVGIASVAHAAEDLLKRCREASPGERLDALLQACDGSSDCSRRRGRRRDGGGGSRSRCARLAGRQRRPPLPRARPRGRPDARRLPAARRPPTRPGAERRRARRAVEPPRSPARRRRPALELRGDKPADVDPRQRGAARRDRRARGRPAGGERARDPALAAS